MTAGEGGDGAGQPAAPDSPEALEHEIEETREQLGDTVAALVAKTDVKAIARQKARDLSSRLTAKAGHTTERVASQAGHARRQLSGQASHARRQLAGRAGQARHQAGRSRTLLGTAKTTGQEVATQPASSPATRAQRAVTAIRQRPVVPAAVASGVLALVIMAAMRGRRR